MIALKKRNLVFWLLASPVFAADPIPLAPQHLVPNRKDVGVCWWACAETIGRYLGIAPFDGLCRRVAETGIGFQGGASPESVQHWLTSLGVKSRSNSHGLTAGGLTWLETQLQQGLPVIASVKRGALQHAVVVLGISDKPEAYDNGHGFKTVDRVVTYWDPNNSAPNQLSLKGFLADHWNGRAYAFDPAEQLPGIVRRGPYPGPPVLGPAPPTPFNPLDIPYTMQNAYNSGHQGQRAVSNQDIKDGVNRPVDFLTYNLFSVYGNPDYYAEFRKKIQNPPGPQR